jgi:hypothetical protein
VTVHLGLESVHLKKIQGIPQTVGSSPDGQGTSREGPPVIRGIGMIPY